MIMVSVLSSVTINDNLRMVVIISYFSCLCYSRFCACFTRVLHYISKVTDFLQKARSNKGDLSAAMAHCVRFAFAKHNNVQ